MDTVDIPWSKMVRISSSKTKDHAPGYNGMRNLQGTPFVCPPQTAERMERFQERVERETCKDKHKQYGDTRW